MFEVLGDAAVFAFGHESSHVGDVSDSLPLSKCASNERSSGIQNHSNSCKTVTKKNRNGTEGGSQSPSAECLAENLTCKRSAAVETFIAEIGAIKLKPSKAWIGMYEQLKELRLKQNLFI